MKSDPNKPTLSEKESKTSSNTKQSNFIADLAPRLKFMQKVIGGKVDEAMRKLIEELVILLIRQSTIILGPKILRHSALLIMGGRKFRLKINLVSFCRVDI